MPIHALGDLIDLSVVIIFLHPLVAFGFPRSIPERVEDQPQPHPPRVNRVN
jgi:hypothetical protein